MNMPAVTPRPLGGETVPTCDARELHASLGVRRDFSTWIKDRITEYGFAEGRDYVKGVSPKSGENSGGRPAVEYHLTLAMAKELAMVENNDRGRAVRRYFIQAEEELRHVRAARPVDEVYRRRAGERVSASTRLYHQVAGQLSQVGT